MQIGYEYCAEEKANGIVCNLLVHKMIHISYLSSISHLECKIKPLKSKQDFALFEGIIFNYSKKKQQPLNGFYICNCHNSPDV